jgi:hypothetical protein
MQRRLFRAQEASMETLKCAGLAIAMTCLAAAAQATPPPGADAVTGRWDAALTDNGPQVPFRLDVVKTDGALKGVFHDGKPNDSTTNASFKDGRLVLQSDHYLTTAALKEGELVGDTTLQGPGYSLHYGFHACVMPKPRLPVRRPRPRT